MPRKIAALVMFATLACADEPAPAPAPAPAQTPPPAPTPARNILFLGTSLTAGYGVGAGNAFPALIQQKLDSAGLPFRIVNAGLSGETSAGGLRRLEWSLQQPVEVLVLELGANDGLRGLSVQQLRANLDSIMARTRARYPDADIVIAGMEAPPNLGRPYTESFRKTYSDLADKYDAVLIPFLLDGVAANAALNQEDGIHPSVQGHARIAETVWQTLQPVLLKRATSPAPAATE
jgi:acyl-CoA thioesterase I